ncbi:hypothetical protein FGO68_gene14209 [Halteria grandinella]|uniref:Uncharacterized protein n=1 Tax=Halteria grandinella TaxID=5974 RepID=A0A8J8T928_HALGN|nr:hypothetical protein FGO68_gene14209 [Halteria grandinella]
MSLQHIKILMCSPQVFKLVLSLVILYAHIKTTQSLQLTTDFSQFPVIYGDDAVTTLDTEILAVDMDASEGILAVGTQISTSGLAIQNLFFSYINSDGLEQWRYYYNLLTGTIFTFVPDEMIYDPDGYTRAIVWDIGPSTTGCQFAVFDTSGKKVTQVVTTATASIFSQFLHVSASDLYVGLNFLTYKFAIQKYTLSGGLYAVQWEKASTMVSTRYFILSGLYKPPEQNFIIAVGGNMNSGSGNIGVGVVNTQLAHGTWSSTSTDFYNFEISNYIGLVAVSGINYRQDVHRGQIGGPFFACGINSNTRIVQIMEFTADPSVPTLDAVNIWLFTQTITTATTQSCQGVRHEPVSDTLFVWYQEFTTTTALAIISIDRATRNTYLTQISTYNTQLRRFQLFVSRDQYSAGWQTLVYGKFQQQLDCTRYGSSSTQYFGLIQKSSLETPFSCLSTKQVLTSLTTTKTSKIVAVSSQYTSAYTGDVTSPPQVTIINGDIPFSLMTADIVNVNRTCQTLGETVYPDITFLASRGTQIFNIPKHRINSQTVADSCTVSLAYTLTIPDADDLTYSLDYSTDSSYLILTVTFGPLAVKSSYQLQISYKSNTLQPMTIVAPIFLMMMGCGTGTDQTLEYTYTIEDPEIVVAGSTYFSGTQCTLTYQVVAVSHSNMFTVSGTVFKFNLTGGEVIIYGVTKGMSGVYRFQLKSYTDSINLFGTITVDVTVITPIVYISPNVTTTSDDGSTTKTQIDANTSPKALKDSDEFFLQCKLDSYTITAGKIYEISLPQCLISKADDIQAIMVLDQSSLSSQGRLDSMGSLIYKPLASTSGIFQQSVSLKDSRLKSIATFKFKITVNSPPPPKIFQCPYGKMEKCHPRITSIDDSGILSLYFPLGLQTPNSSQLVAAAAKDLKIVLQEQKYAEIPSSIKEWSITEYSKYTVKVQLVIDNPLYISTTKDYDNVTLQILSEICYESLEDQYTLPLKVNLTSSIPPQKSNSTLMKMVENAFAFVDSSLTTGVIVNAVLGVVLGASMKRMWALINTLQILTHVPLLNFVLPTNLQICLTLVVKISSLNVVPKSLVNTVVGFIQSQTSNLNENMSDEASSGSSDDGFQKGQFVKNIGYIIVAVIGLAMVMILIGGLGIIARRFKGQPDTILFKLLQDSKRLHQAKRYHFLWHSAQLYYQELSQALYKCSSGLLTLIYSGKIFK